MKRIIFYITVLAIFTAITVSCARADGAEESVLPEELPSIPAAESPVRAPSASGALKIDAANPKTFNPILNENESVDRLLRLVFEPLIALDENMKPIPALASSWEFTPDGLAVTLRIRNAVWEDGVEVTAEDVKYTIETIITAPDTSLYKNCAINIAAINTVDEKTVKIEYQKPFAAALYNLTFPILPSHYYKGAANSDTTMYPLGSGLFTLDEFNSSENIKLVKSKSCYRGEAQIDELEAIIMRGTETPLYAFEQNIIDMTLANSSDWKKISTSRPAAITKYPSQSYEFLALNYKNPVLYNVNVRKAVASVVPRDTIIDKYYSGNMFKTDTPLNPQSWLYESNTEKYDYDIEKAREYLNISNVASLGTVRVLANESNNERVLTATIMAEELRKIGFVTELEITDTETYKTKLLSGDFDIAAAGFDLSLLPDFAQLFGNNGDTLGTYNYISFRSDLMDAYLAQADAAIFEAAQKTAYSNMQKLFAEQLPYISIGYKATVILTGENIIGEIIPSINSPYYNFTDLSVSH